MNRPPDALVPAGVSSPCAESCESCSEKIMVWSVGTSLVLTFLKVLGGSLFGSSALMADGIQSFSCMVGALLIMVGIRISRRNKDAYFPFGYR
ncbi:MAG: cation transporter, partial [Planctomycetes bacterium]|nr:cation transporter [Planctomycetota bacterium]